MEDHNLDSTIMNPCQSVGSETDESPAKFVILETPRLRSSNIWPHFQFMIHL